MPEHAELQQTPSTQKPLVHSVPAEQTSPKVLRVTVLVLVEELWVKLFVVELRVKLAVDVRGVG